MLLGIFLKIFPRIPSEILPEFPPRTHLDNLPLIDSDIATWISIENHPGIHSENLPRITAKFYPAILKKNHHGLL